jgi:hypothetical protein
MKREGQWTVGGQIRLIGRDDPGELLPGQHLAAPRSRPADRIAALHEEK